MNVIQTDYTVASNSKITIIIARFNYFINTNLLSGTMDILTRIGKIQEKNIILVKVPGSYEIPFIAHNIALSKQSNAIITLGTIIQGETMHAKNMISNINYLLSKISIRANIPIISGILMTKNIEQAIERSGCKKGNKGCEAAYTTLEILNLLKFIH